MPKPARCNIRSDGYQFAGATMDFTAFYRLEAVLDLYAAEGISVALVHQHVQQLQQAFLAELKAQQHPLLNEQQLLCTDLQNHGHFFTFRLEDAAKVAELSRLFKTSMAFIPTTEATGCVLVLRFIMMPATMIYLV